MTRTYLHPSQQTRNPTRTQARNQLATLGGVKSFVRGAQIFFPKGVENFLGGFSPLRPPSYSPACTGNL